MEYLRARRLFAVLLEWQELSSIGEKTEEEDAFKKIQDSRSNEKTMAFFDPNRSIILHAEVNFNQGLTTDLLQTTNKGIQPIHFISRTLTERAKRYRQTEKDSFVIKWEKAAKQ